jgi:tRNA dimethylallyltransferase
LTGFFVYLTMANEKTVIIIAGPTAVGKTSFAIEVAKYFKTEIISADSRQCYKELNIGVARPSERELQEVKHHFIASHSIHEKINAASFEAYALEKADEIFEKNGVAVMVGGTGLYIKAFCEGMDEIPEVPEVVRNEIVNQYQHQGIEWLQQEVQRSDPKFYAVGEHKNPHRLMRALEVFKATGKSVLDFRKGNKAIRDFNIVKIALQLTREELHRNIESRVDKMMEMGLLEEVRSLIPYQHLNALQTVGYKELLGYFNGEIDLQTAVALVKRNTKQYAKRQMTWFKKDKEYYWTEPTTQNVIELLQKS